MIVPGLGPGLGTSDPFQVLGPFEQLRHDIAEGGVGVANDLHSLAHCGAQLHVDVRDFLPEQFRPMLLVIGRADHQLESHGLTPER